MDELEDHWWDFECNWRPKEVLKVIIERSPYQSDLTQRGSVPAPYVERPGGAGSVARACYEETKQNIWSGVWQRGGVPALKPERER